MIRTRVNSPQSPFATVALTVLALAAFAANSLLARFALAREQMDPFAYTLARLLAGAVVLAVLNRLNGGRLRLSSTPRQAGYLLLYALPFSLAYVRLSTGMGALIAFASVQLTMLAGAALQGERPGLRIWGASGLAFCGLVYLVLPGLRAPDLLGSALMVAAGVGWGLYSLEGNSSESKVLEATASAFVLATALMIPIAVLGVPRLGENGPGLPVALFSGAVTSGLGYAIWYRALQRLTSSHAALAQLTVPVMAAVAGAWLLGEALTWRLLIAAAVILGSLALGLRKR